MAGVSRFVHQIRERNATPDLALAELAERQHGAVEYRQLRALGFTRGMIDSRVRAGRLHRLHVGVYAVGHRRVTRLGHVMAAVLAAGPGAVASHRTAAELWGIRRTSSPRIDVTAPGRVNRSRRGVVIHAARRLDEAETALVQDIPATAVVRTLIDLAAVLTRRDLERAFEEADRRGLLDVRELEAALVHSDGRRGIRALSEITGAAKPPPPFTRSELERRFVQLCERAGLPRPSMNLFVEGFEVDACWPERSLIVELDGWDAHRTRADFERDRARDMALEAAGHTVVLVTWLRVVREPAPTARSLRMLYGRAAPPRAVPMLHSVK